MKSLTLVLAVAVAMLAGPVWAAGSGSFHAMAKVTAASSLSSDELDAVEGGIVTLGPSFLTAVPVASISQFMGYVLQQQYGVGPYPPIVVSTTIGATPFGTGVTFTPNYHIQPNTLVCTGCFLP
jgi:hypothetical protein